MSDFEILMLFALVQIIWIALICFAVYHDIKQPYINTKENRSDKELSDIDLFKTRSIIEDLK